MFINEVVIIKYIKIFKNKYGYLVCYLYKNGQRKTKTVHRLVAEAFIPNINNFSQVNHKDEKKENCRVNNLEWCTRKYNIQYSKNKPVIQYSLKLKKIKEWDSIKSAKLGLKMKNPHIGDCCSGKRKTAAGYIWRFKEVK